MRDAMLILHFIGLAMVLGTTLGYAFIGASAPKYAGEDLKKYIINISPLSKMGNYGLIVMLLSGGYLMTGFWASLMDFPLLLTKLVLYLALGAIAGIMSSKLRKIRNGNVDLYPGVQNLGRIYLLISLAVVILAVFVFH